MLRWFFRMLRIYRDTQALQLRTRSVRAAQSAAVRASVPGALAAVDVRRARGARAGDMKTSRR